MSNLTEMIVEWVAGDDVRHEWDERTGVLRRLHRQDKSAPPEHYGCIPGALAPADGELLDVLLLRDVPRRPGERVAVRLIGVLRRSDGDSKLVAIDPAQGDLGDVHALDVARREAMWRWFSRQHVLLGWAGPEVAQTLLDDARRCWLLARGEVPCPAISPG